MGEPITTEKKQFDYRPYEISSVSPSTIKKMITLALEPGSFVKKIVAAVQLIIAGIGVFILWRMQSNAEAKHKQDYEYGKTKDNQDDINDDDLD